MMHHLGPWVMTFGGAAALFVYRRELQDALERFHHRGPRPPTGLIPANDSFLLRRKRSRFVPPAEWKDPTFPY
jgi:hypothetical protein